MTEDLVGSVVGKYHVRAKLGTGSMGDVYEATNGAQHVALKVLKVDDKTLVARFLREAKTMSLFQHPNIVELVEVGQHGERMYFAAELVRGVTLRDLINGGPVETKRALAIVRQILTALGHAHAMGVVHRDIKPENVMLVDGGSPDGQSDMVKILDFGVAKLIGDTPTVLGEGTLTITGYGALGTPYYISPEAVLGRVLDARADLYSIGVLLFEMLVGKPPYTHEDVAVLMRMHAAAPIPTLKERAPDRDASPELELLISEALAKKPDLRFKSAAEMVEAVDQAVRALDPFFDDAPAPAAKSNKSTDLFGAMPIKAPAPLEPSASAPAAFSPSSIPSASQPVQPEPIAAAAAPRKTRPALPGVAPYQTPVAGVPMISGRPSTDPAGGTGTAATEQMGAQTAHHGGHHVGGPVMGVVVPARGGGLPPEPAMFAPPMPAYQKVPKGQNKLLRLAKQHKKYVAIGGGVFVLLLIIVIAATRGGGKSSSTKKSDDKVVKKDTPSKSELVKAAQEQIAAGRPARAVELIEKDEIPDNSEVYAVLGHARIASNRKLDGIAAFERAIKLDKSLAADTQIRGSVQRVLDSADIGAAIVALELALRLDPPAHDLVKQVATNGKQSAVRRRAFAIAEREKFVDGIDRLESWSLDLAQAQNCEERMAAVLKLRRIADPRAIPALKRAKTHRCVETAVAEAIAYLESQPVKNPQ